MHHGVVMECRSRQSNFVHLPRAFLKGKVNGKPLKEIYKRGLKEIYKEGHGPTSLTISEV